KDEPRCSSRFGRTLQELESSSRGAGWASSSPSVWSAEWDRSCASRPGRGGAPASTSSRTLDSEPQCGPGIDLWRRVHILGDNRDIFRRFFPAAGAQALPLLLILPRSWRRGARNGYCPTLDRS